MRTSFIYLLLICFITSCKELAIFEKNVNIPEQRWDYSFKPTYTFKITDTTAYYNIFIVIRHTDAYEYNNIWLKFSSQLPGDTMRSRHLNLSLGNDAKGWEGKGMHDIYEVRKLVNLQGPEKLRKAGEYYVQLAQVMRENPLRHVLSVGVRLEKVNIQNMTAAN